MPVQGNSFFSFTFSVIFVVMRVGIIITMEPKKMGLLDWSTSSYGRGMQWKETGIWTARKPQEICMKLITRNIMQTLHGIALLSHQITT